jgi:hypothetical protein
MKAPPIDHNIEKWTAFCRDDEHAEEMLKNKLLLLSQKKLIVSAKKQLIESRARLHGLFIYKFTIVTALK